MILTKEQAKEIYKASLHIKLLNGLFAGFVPLCGETFIRITQNTDHPDITIQRCKGSFFTANIEAEEKYKSFDDFAEKYNVV